MSTRNVQISVHERTDADGFIVRLVVGQGDQEHVARYPCNTKEEAEDLSLSIKGYIEVGCDLNALLPDAEK